MVGFQRLSDSWFNSCPLSKCDLQIGILVRAHAPMCLSVSKKEKRASFSDIALWCTCVMVYGSFGHVCLVETSEQEEQWGHPSTASVFTGFIDIQCLYWCQWVFSLLFVPHLFLLPSLLLSPSPFFPVLYPPFLLPSSQVLTLFSSFPCNSMKHSWWVRPSVNWQVFTWHPSEISMYFLEND